MAPARAEGAQAVAPGVKPFEGHAWAPLSCGAPTGPGFVHCMAKVLVDENGAPKVFAGQQGYGASDIQSAYGLPTSGSGGKIVALIDAYDYPTAEQDLASYRSAGNGSSGSSAAPTAPTADAGASAGNNASGNSGGNADVAGDLDAPPAGCACSMVGSGENAGGLALGLGLVLGLAARRRRRARV